MAAAGGVAALGQELALNDDFSRYADGAPPVEVWDVLAGAGHWRMAPRSRNQRKPMRLLLKLLPPPPVTGRAGAAYSWF